MLLFYQYICVFFIEIEHIKFVFLNFSIIKIYIYIFFHIFTVLEFFRIYSIFDFPFV